MAQEGKWRKRVSDFLSLPLPGAFLFAIVMLSEARAVFQDMCPQTERLFFLISFERKPIRDSRKRFFNPPKKGTPQSLLGNSRTKEVSPQRAEIMLLLSSRGSGSCLLAVVNDLRDTVGVQGQSTWPTVFLGFWEGLYHL